MYAEAPAQGKRFALINISPFGNSAFWGSSKQAITDSYNSLSAAWASTNNVPYADIYTALEDGGSPDDLAAAYDSGDGLHPNAAGSQLIADTMIAAIKTFSDVDMGVLLNRLPKGRLIEGLIINRALYNRDFTNAAWTKTNVTAAKDATGLDGVANSASTLTATAGNGTCFQTVTLTSLQRTSSIYVKRKTGTGTIEFTDDGGTSYTDITLLIGTGFFYRTDPTTTQANPSIGFRIVTSGDEIEVDGAQIEDDSSRTSVIFTTTVGVQRNRDEEGYSTANLPISDLAIKLKWTPEESGQSTPRILGSGTAGNNRVLIYHNNTNFIVIRTISTVSHTATLTLGYSEKVTNEIKVRIGAEGLDIWVDGTKGTGDATVGDAEFAATMYLGADWDAGFQQSCQVDDLIVCDGVFTDAEMVAL